MKPREYCCCAIPTVNAGIYLTLIEQFAVGIIVGVLSMATPSIVGAVTPSVAPWVLGIVCFVAAAIQILGFIGVAKERPILFRRYISLHSIAILGVFAVSLTWIILSVTRHSTAQANCIKNFFDANDDTQQTEAEIMCKIFPYVDVGVMGGLWIILAILHIYLYIVITSYSSGQQRDRAKYDALGSPNQTNENIAMNPRADAWDARDSTDDYRGGGNGQYGHVRQQSGASMSDVMSEPMRQPRDGMSDYNYQQQQTYPPQQAYRDDQPSYGHPSRQGSRDTYVSHPSTAYTQAPAATPRFTEGYYGGPSKDLDRPAQAQPHPAEGSFRRKTPRMTKPTPGRTYDGY